MMKMNKTNIRTRRRVLGFVFASVMALSVFAAPNLPGPFTTNAAPATAYVLDEDDNVQQRTEVDILNSFPGGIERVMGFLQQHMQYPEACKQKGVQGRVFVRFSVNRKGRVCKVKGEYKPTKKDKDKTFGKEEKKLQKQLVKEGERVVKLLPKFKPALKDGKPVDARLTLPIQFRLQ